MKKKDYELIAGVFAKVAVYTKSQGVDSVSNETVDTMARFMASTLALNNPKFNIDKFLTLCGIETEDYTSGSWRDEIRQGRVSLQD